MWAAWTSLWNSMTIFSLKHPNPCCRCAGRHQSNGAEKWLFISIRVYIPPLVCLIIGNQVHRVNRLRAKNSPCWRQYLPLFYWETGGGCWESLGKLRTNRGHLMCLCVPSHTHRQPSHLWSPRQHLNPQSSFFFFLSAGEIRDPNDCCLAPPLSTFLSASGTNSTSIPLVSRGQMKP